MRVAIADDSALFRSGLVRLLEASGVEVVAEASEGQQLLRLIESDPPDVAIVDIRMPPAMSDEGIKVAQELRRRWPGIGVLVLSTYLETDFAKELLAASPAGVGYLLKDRVEDIDELLSALSRLTRGGSVLDPELVARLLGRKRTANPLDAISSREREILALMAQGRTNQAICERLFLSERTVESHVSSIFAKLGLEPTPDNHRRVSAVLLYLDRS